MLDLISTACVQSPDKERIAEHEIGRMPVQCTVCLQYVNMAMTILRPHAGLSMEANQQVVFQNANYLIKDLTLEEHYLYMRRAEALAASVGLLYQQRIIKEKIPNPKSAMASSDFTKAVKEQRDATRPKKEKKLLSDRDRAIEAFTKLGIKLDAAEKMVDEQMIKEGRAVNPTE